VVRVRTKQRAKGKGVCRVRLVNLQANEVEGCRGACRREIILSQQVGIRVVSVVEELRVVARVVVLQGQVEGRRCDIEVALAGR
jgi:hypothetical protein